MAIFFVAAEAALGLSSEIENRKLKIEDYGKVHDLRFSNSVFRCSFAALGNYEIGGVNATALLGDTLREVPYSIQDSQAQAIFY